MENYCLDGIGSSSIATELDDEQKSILANLTTLHRLNPGDVLFREGERNSELYVITCGCLAVTRETGNGDYVVLHMLRTNDIAGELGFLDNLEHSATIRAIEASDVYSLRRDQLEGLINDKPLLVYRIMRAIIREVHGILRRMNSQHVELTNYITKQHGRY